MWSVPYNLNIYNSYFGIGVVNLDTTFSRDMMPYWYRQMIGYQKGKSNLIGRGEQSTVESVKIKGSRCARGQQQL